MQRTIIKIIGWLYILSGILILLMQGQYLFSPDEISEGLSKVGISFPLFVLETIVISVIMVVAGLGLLKLLSWSWWLAIFIETNTIVSKLNNVVILFSGDPVEFQLKQLFGVVVSCIILIFLFRDVVASMFNVKENNSKALSIMFGVNIGLIGLLGAINI